MADIRLITILPPQPIQGVQQPQVAGNQSGQVTIGTLPVGSVLSGFIINRDSGGNPVLRTDSGDITFSSNFFLKIGSEITIRIEHSAGSNSAHILSVNGQPPEVAVQQSGFAPEPEVIVSENLRSANQPTTAQTANVPTTTSSTPTITVTGTIISPATAQPHIGNPTLLNNPAPTLQPLPNGSQLSLKIVGLSTPQTITTPLPTTQAAPAEIIPTNTTTVTTPPTTITPQNTASTPISNPYAAYARTSAATPASPQQATVQTATQPITTQNPSAPLPTNQPPQAGQQIIATVISNDPNGEAIVQTPIGIIRLQAGTQLPIGSHATFEITQIQTPEILEKLANPLLASNIATAPAPLTQLARNAGALNNIFTLLSGLGTGDALTFINKNIPTIAQSPTNPSSTEQPNNLLASILTFASALRSGDFRQWLGRGNAKWLADNGHENLLKKAEGEFLSIARQFGDTPAKQWQSLFFPIAIAGELQQTRLFVKRDRKQKENNGRVTNEENTRFVLEMDLSQLGEMQMDGFVRNNNKNIQFDLIIRSNTALSQEIQKDILNIYNNIGELTGYQGSLSFQTVKDFPVNPMEEIITGNHETFVI